MSIPKIALTAAIALDLSSSLHGAFGAPAVAATTAPAATPVAIQAFQTATSSKLYFAVDRSRAVTARAVPGGVEVRIDGNLAYRVANLPTLREVAGIDVRTEGNASIALIRLAVDCDLQQVRGERSFKIELVDKPKDKLPPPAAALPPASAALPPPPPGPIPQPASAQPATPQVQAKSELDNLRDSFAQKLTLLASPTPPASQPAAPGDSSPAVAGTQNVQPIPTVLPCPPEFTMDGWKGDEKFAQRLQALRILAARFDESPDAMAALAEFYIGNGLGAEALAVIQQTKLDPSTPEQRKRAARDGDLAKLLKGQPIDATSTLLAATGACARTDIPLWHALAAAAEGDLPTLIHDAEGAGQALTFIPSPLSNILALRLANSAQGNPVVLKAMAAALRNSDPGAPEDVAGRFLLQAQIARTRNDKEDEANFLERAATETNLTGLQARIRLAELHVAANDGDKAKSLLLLADMARVYRDTSFGQSAATVLSDLRLGQGDYLGALQISTDATAALASQQTDSYGAALAAKVLRQLLATKDAPNLPDAQQRLMIYWRYSGYATPGEKGDDVRMGAAQLMLDQAMPEAALDVIHQLAAPTLQTPQGSLLRAQAEAQAGDPNLAIALVGSLPEGDDKKNVTATALGHLGKPLDAAHQLDGLGDLAHQLRRAALLYEAKNWGDAADAYADVLHNTTIGNDDRDEAANRYALALALSGKAPASDLHAFSGLALHLLSALPKPQTDAPPDQPVAAIRDSLNRAKQIETLLPPVDHATTAPGG